MFNELWSRLKNYLQTRPYKISLGKLVGLDDLDPEDIVFFNTVCPVLGSDPGHPYNITKNNTWEVYEKATWKQTLRDCIGKVCMSRTHDGTPITLLSLEPGFRRNTLLFELKNRTTIFIYFTHIPWHISIMQGTVVEASRVLVGRGSPEQRPFTIHLTDTSRGHNRSQHLYLVVPPMIRSMAPGPCLQLNARDCYKCSRILTEGRFVPGPEDTRLTFSPHTAARGAAPRGAAESTATWAVNGTHTPLRSVANVESSVSGILRANARIQAAQAAAAVAKQEEKITKRQEEESRKRREKVSELESRRIALVELLRTNRRIKRALETNMALTTKNFESIDAQTKAIDSMFRLFLEFVRSGTVEAKRNFLSAYDACSAVLKSFLETDPDVEKKTMILAFLFETLSQFPPLLVSIAEARAAEARAAEARATGAAGAAAEAENIEVIDPGVILNKIERSIGLVISESTAGNIASLMSQLTNFKGFFLTDMPVARVGGHRYTRRSLRKSRTKKNNTRK